MPNNVGFEISIGNLPEGFSGTPQEFADKIAELLEIAFEEDFALFKRGAVQPNDSTNAWLKDGRIWYVFDLDTGEWVPASIAEAYKKIYVRSTDPWAAPDAQPIEPGAIWVEINTGAAGVKRMSVYLDGGWRVIADNLSFTKLKDRVDSAIKEEGGLKEDVVGFGQVTDDAVTGIRKAVLNSVYPIGSLYPNATASGNPATLMDWPESTWVEEGQGRVLMGHGTGSGLTARVAGQEIGAEEVTLTAAQSGVPAHTHPYNNTSIRHKGGSSEGTVVGDGSVDQGASLNFPTGPNAAQNAEDAHPNIQPSLVVYMWRRTA